MRTQRPEVAKVGFATKPRSFPLCHTALRLFLVANKQTKQNTYLFLIAICKSILCPSTFNSVSVEC